MGPSHISYLTLLRRGRWLATLRVAPRSKNIFNPIIKYLTDTFHPLSLKIDYVKSESFTGYIVGSELNNITVADKRLTDYDKNDIVKHGIDAVVVIHRQHTIKSQPISCVHMNEIKSNNPMDCPIYYTMKENCDFNAEHLAHLNEFNHFLDEYNEKTICQSKDKCAAFIRLENGRNVLSDQCHIKLYLHPARKRYMKLWQNANSLMFETKARRNHVLYMPVAGSNSADYDEWDGYLHVLIEEVIVNGYQYDLCLQCAVNEREECKHNIYDDKYSILTMVTDKMECHRHKSIGKPLRRDHMLSLILYTNCECSYDLCGSQRKGDYGKWKWFDYCLWNAIDELSRRESGSFTVYSAINRVKLDKKSVECGYFATYVSSSWNKAVADRFLINGMVIEMDKEFKNNAFVRCADVSWISKFADEFEVLFARSLDCNSMKFKCVVLNESHGVQTVSLKR